MLPKYLILILILGVLINCTSKKSEEESKPKTIALSPEFIKENGIIIGTPELKQVSEEIKVKGTVEVPPNAQSVIHSKTDGYIRQINFLEGDIVKAGATVAIIENPYLIEKQKQLKESQSQLTYANQELKRQQTLYKSEATSLKNLQQAQNSVNSINATISGLKQELSAIGANSSNYSSIVQVKANSSGIISKILVNRGAYVSTQTPIIEVINDSEKHIVIEVPVQYANQLSKNLPIKVLVGGQELSGTTIKVNPAIDETKKTISVHCHLTNHANENLLKPNAIVNVLLYLGEENKWTLPKDAVIEEGEKYYVIEDDNQKPNKVEVQGNFQNNYFVLDTTSILRNKKVVTKGVYYLK